MTYAGLTTADKPALLDAKVRGAEWVARDKDDELVGFRLKPQKYVDMELNINHWKRTQAGNYFIVMPSDEPLKFIQWSDAEPVNIDLALAQIAEMESALPDHAPRHEQPMTLNDWLNGATVEEKAKWLYDMDVCRVSSISIEECNSYRHCTDCMRNLLNSPYTEGATK